MYSSPRSPPIFPGGFVIDFRHAATGIVLNMAEATMLQGLPEEMKLRSHPGLPGRAAWTMDMSILQVGMVLRRAGFASSKEELANPRQVPPKPEPAKAEQSHIIQLAPGIIMDMSGMMPREKEEEEEISLENLVFNCKALGDRIMVIFGLKHPEYPDDPPEDLSIPVLVDTGAIWPVLAPIIEICEHDNWRALSKYDIGETIRLLEAGGVTRDNGMLLWFDPEELEFGGLAGARRLPEQRLFGLHPPQG